MQFEASERRGRRPTHVWSAMLRAVLLGALVATLALGAVTPASTQVSASVSLVGLVVAAVDAEDLEGSLLAQLLSQVQQLQEEEEDLHPPSVAAIALPTLAPRDAPCGRLVAASDAVTSGLSRPPRA